MRFYSRYATEHKNTLGWPTLEDARIVYSSATSADTQDWTTIRSVLDAGAGEGHLGAYLRQERGYSGSYTGIELFQPSYVHSIRHYGEAEKTHLIHGDFIEHDFQDATFDWAFSLGSLSARVAEQDAFNRATVARLVELSRVGFTVYLNDRALFPANRLAEVDGLMTHDIGAFCDLISEFAPGGAITCNRLPGENHCVLLHVLHSEARQRG